MADINLEEQLPLLSEKDPDYVEGNSFSKYRWMNKVPRYWYHSPRKPISGGTVSASAHPAVQTRFVTLTSYPLTFSIRKGIIVIDITKLDSSKLALESAIEGSSSDALLYKGDLPSTAVASYNLEELIGPYDKPKTTSAEAAPVQAENQEPEIREFKIKESSLPWLDKHFGRMAKVAVEVGCQPPTYTKVREEFVPVYKRTKPDPLLEAVEGPGAGSTWVLDANGNKIIDHYDHYYYITVQGEPPKLKDWTFVATVTHTKTGNLINHAPGQVLDVPEKYRAGDPWCDYCETRRMRTDSFIVKNEKTGEYKQIGRNCLAKFLGFSNPKRVANYAEWLNNIDSNLQGDIDEEEERNYGVVDPYENLEDFLTMVAAVTRLKGWVTKAQAEAYDKVPSIMEVRYQLEESHPGDRDWPRNQIHPTEEDRKRAKEAIAYARSDKLKADTDFKSNLKVATAGDYFHRKADGVVAALINFQDRDKEWELQQEMRKKEMEARKAAEKNSEWLGKEGDKLKDITVRVLLAKNLDSQFGVTYLFKMITPDGNLLTWFSSNDVMDQGEWYKLSGTIKKLETYEGKKQTTVTRCKVTKIDPPAGYEKKEKSDLQKAIDIAKVEGHSQPTESSGQKAYRKMAEEFEAERAARWKSLVDATKALDTKSQYIDEIDVLVPLEKVETAVKEKVGKADRKVASLPTGLGGIR